MTEIGLFEAIYSARSLRRLKPDPVPDEILSKILDAAIRAPSAGNAQHWAFVLVREPEQRRKLGAIYRKASDIASAIYRARGRPAHMSEEQYRKFLAAGSYLWDHMGEAPVLLVPCLREGAPHPRRQHLSGGAEHHARLPRVRARHGDHHEPHPPGGRSQGRARPARRRVALRADAR